MCRVRAGFHSRTEPHTKLVHIHRFAVGSTCSFRASRRSLRRCCTRICRTCGHVFTHTNLPRMITMGSSSNVVNNDISRRCVLLAPMNRSAVTCYSSYSCETGVRTTTDVARGGGSNSSRRLGLIRAPGVRAVRSVYAFLNAPLRGSYGTIICRRGSSSGFIIMFVENSLSMGRAGLAGCLYRGVRPKIVARRYNLGTKFVNPYGLDNSFEIICSDSLGNAGGLSYNTGGRNCRCANLYVRHSIPSTRCISMTGVATNNVYPGYNGRAVGVSHNVRMKGVFRLKAGCAGDVGVACLSGSNGTRCPVVNYCNVNINELTTSMYRTRRSRCNPV